MELLKPAGDIFFRIKRKASVEIVSDNTRTPSIANTTQNLPEFQLAENKSRLYVRNGTQKFGPVSIQIRPDNYYYDGRNLNLLNSIKARAYKDFPDVITARPLKVVGYY